METRIEYFEDLETLPIYNWNQFTQTSDKNWFIRGFDGRQKKESNEYLDKLSERLQDDYFKLLGNDGYLDIIQTEAKKNYLILKHNTVVKILGEIQKASLSGDNNARHSYIKLLEKFRFKIPLINTFEGDMEELQVIFHDVNGILTKIKMLEDELEDSKPKTIHQTLTKQMIILSIGLELGYKINAKETTVAEWVEMINLLKEKNEINAVRPK